jgi:hypothetical protein
MLLTGACGDEFLFRAPYTIAIWAAWHNIKIEKYLKTFCYHAHYFAKEKNIVVFQDFYSKRKQIQEQYPTQHDLIYHLLDVNANDHQHWHLGNTITWTPLKDLELNKLVLQLSIDDLLQQILDAKINKMVIERLHPQSLNFLCQSKNHNAREKLHLLQ